MFLAREHAMFQSARPFVRWWWLSGHFHEADIARQLQWILEQGFGGVEIAWIDPSWLDEPERSASRPAFLDPDWTRLVAFAKTQADALGLGCDFTFGSCWPFAGSWLQDADVAQTFDGPSAQRVGCSWEVLSGEQIRVLNHLSSKALLGYAQPLLAALGPALAAGPSALFCDSLEIATEGLWSANLWDEFATQFGYRLEEFKDETERDIHVRYDYRKLLGQVIVREFYESFSLLCHRSGAYSRVQCHGAPADLLSAYAAADIPESEALLFSPYFSRIAASAAAWAGRQIVSAEAFTCIYGFPGWDDGAEELWKEETTGDLKLLADALFANGVNQLVWHGMPYRPAGGQQEFYAAVHVGEDSPFADELSGLNGYFSQVCEWLRSGKTYAVMGVYLPNEDAAMLDRIPEEDRTPGANFHWEMRHAKQPNELQGFAPIWISIPFLKEAHCQSGTVISRELCVAAIYVNCQWMDAETLVELERLAASGAKIIWKSRPSEPGRMKTDEYDERIVRLAAAGASLPEFTPLVESVDSPLYWARTVNDSLLVFFAHPQTKHISYPMKHNLSQHSKACQVPVKVRWKGFETPLVLRFGWNDSLLLEFNASGSVRQIQLPSATRQ